MLRLEAKTGVGYETFQYTFLWIYSIVWPKVFVLLSVGKNRSFSILRYTWVYRNDNNGNENSNDIHK